MKYHEAMELLSQCGIGALLLADDHVILEINQAGERLLGSDHSLAGKRLPAYAQPLCEPIGKNLYARTRFGEYVARCANPDVDELPPGSQLIVFREASNDACHDMLIHVINQITEAVVLCDEEGRIYYINDAAVRMDSFLSGDAAGQTLDKYYTMLDGKELAIPQVLKTKRPMLNHRQHYSTCYGREVVTMANTYPIIQNGQLLGAVNVLEDWSNLDSLHKQIIDLQEKLSNKKRDKSNADGSALSANYCFRDIVHVSDAMDTVIAQCRQVAKSDSSVMIYGETGCGKEMFAQSIHNASRRAKQPFLAINCAAIPENLLESLLFGSEKGAFTGAEKRIGLFEQADGGTLLLDEINSMDINLQTKLLRVLQEGKIRRVGGLNEIRVDVRVMSNINIPPYQAMEENKLRRDLYYRLGVVNINIPPLRERVEDIPLLSKQFVMQCNQKLERNIRDIDKDTLALFQQYSWPGNVRELQHAIEHAMNILPDGMPVIMPAFLPEHIRIECQRGMPSAAPAQPHDIDTTEKSLGSTIKGIERQTICRVLWENGGNISKSARVLQMSRQNLQYRIKRYQIDVAALLRGESDEDGTSSPSP